MPELPEVEFARRVLEGWLRGAAIEAVRVLDPRILDEGARPGTVVARLTGRRVEAVERRGKWLRIVLDRGFVFSHLGMTGKWVRGDRDGNGDEPVRFEKIRIDAKRGRARVSVRYADPRLFGRFVVTDQTLPIWAALGADPLHDGIDIAALFAALSKRKVAIKQALLDQTLLAGVGNIQATEALFFARIDPRSPSSALSRADVGALAKGIFRSIEATLEHQKGEAIRYVEEPGADNPFTIYGHEGERCPRCKNTVLSKVILGGRGTVFCTRCQRLRGAAPAVPSRVRARAASK